ncbi:iron-containing alcohol dehydrogenase [Halorarum halobium]|uniref:iron-containing alcohol dehydrogenase n=1 Tax=Halorarum halobium TaxID=3075121 RepID=UPI0028A5DE76|nr:iron-containing alcohol dehydrogenase [Halobaculum sp. XH14]
MADHEFRHWYGPTELTAGPGCVEALDRAVREAGGSSALVVAGRSVSQQPAVMDPILAGLGDAYAATFTEVTADKTYESVRAAAARVREDGIDAVVGVGGGGCMDAARAVSVVAAHPEADPQSLFADVDERGELTLSRLPNAPLPVVEVPTTLSGAEVTCAAGMNVVDPDGGHVVRTAPIIHPDIWPAAIFYDPELAVETPERVITTSAMNGLDHGIEMLYSRNAIPMTDATAAHGVRVLSDALPRLGANPDDVDAMGDAMVGVALSTTGLIDPTSGPKYSIVHAFGHQLAQQCGVQQGLAHGVMAPDVLAYVFENVDGRRDLLADALGVDAGGTAVETGDAVVEAVRDVRDGLGLPSRLRDLDAVDRAEFDALGAAIEGDIGLTFAPEGLDPTPESLTRVLERAW